MEVMLLDEEHVVHRIIQTPSFSLEKRRAIKSYNDFFLTLDCFCLTRLEKQHSCLSFSLALKGNGLSVVFGLNSRRNWSHAGTQWQLSKATP